MSASFGQPPRPLVARPERESDRGFLLALYSTTRERELALLPWNDEQKQRFVRAQFEAQSRDYHARFADARFEVIELEGEPIGRRIVDERADELRIVDLAIDPAHRNRGIGARLIGEIQEEAKGKGLVVRFHVEEFNPARRLYERLGFVEIESNGAHRLLQWAPEASA